MNNLRKQSIKRFNVNVLDYKIFVLRHRQKSPHKFGLRFMEGKIYVLKI